MSEQSNKDQMLNKLKIHLDEPIEDKLYFKFTEHAENIAEFLINEKTPSPFSIAIHGEWGSGKTTFVKKIKRIVDDKINESKLNWKTVEFDAWEYERMDLVSALLKKIQQQYDENSDLITKFSDSIDSFVVDAVLRKTVGMSKDDAKDHFKEFFEHITTIRETIEEIVKDSRLIIFVDDLDRCLVDNVLDMLEAIKMFLNSKNVIFVFAVDMTKIERAWELRHRSNLANDEGRDHIEKIFQLKLTLPPKLEKDLHDYIKEKIAQSFSGYDTNFFINVCPRNPRKIVRMLNQIYFALSKIDIPGNSMEEQNDNFGKYLPIIMTWSSITTNYPYIAKIIKQSPSYLIQMALLCNEYEFQHKLKQKLPSVLEYYKTKNLDFTPNTVPIPQKEISFTTIEGLDYVSKNGGAYKTLKAFAKEFDIQLDGSKGDPVNNQMKKFYDDLIEPIRDIINHTLIGI